MTARRQPLELLWVHPGGREQRWHLGRLAATLAAGLIGAVTIGLIVLTALLPGALDRAGRSREMDVALRRRAQLGERLHGLVRRAELLAGQVRMHGERVQRVRALYGLPELPARPLGPHDVRPWPPTIFAGAVLYARRLVAGMEANLSRTDALVASLGEWEASHPDAARTVPAVLPLTGGDVVLLSRFGRGRDDRTGGPTFHAGLELAAPAGAPIRAPAAGVVRWAGNAPPSAGAAWWRLGQVVVLAHGSSYRTLFGYCDRILVRVGQRVASGDPIATVGTSGWAPTPRLHYEVRRRDSEGDWQAVDPMSLLLDLGALRADSTPQALPAGGEEALRPPALPSAFRR